MKARASSAEQIRALLDAVEAAALPSSRSLPPAEGRENFHRLMLPLVAPEPPVPTVDRTVTGPGGPIPIRVYARPAAAPLPAVVYLHGGGFVFGSLRSHDATCRSLANDAALAVVAVDYRLAPEHPFPAALDDCAAVVGWLADHGRSIGVDGRRVAVAGDSAGGTLAASTALRARDRMIPPIAHQLLMYPATQPRPPATDRDTSASDPFLTREEMDWFWERYLGVEGVEDPPAHAAPSMEDLTGVAPATLLLAGVDPLLDEGLAYADRLRQAGVPAEVRLDEYMMHGFLLFTRYLDAGREALGWAAGRLHAALTA